MKFIFSSFIFLILLCLPLFFINEKDILLYLDVYSIIIFLFSLRFFYKNSKENIIITSYIVFGILATLIISLLVEEGAYLFEVQEVSYTTGITSKAAIQCFLFLFGLVLSSKLSLNFGLKFINFNNSLFLFTSFFIRGLIIIFILGLIYVGIKYGTPKDYAIHRGDYWGKIAPTWGKWLLDNIIQLVFLLGFLFAKTKNRIDLALALFILITIVWLGERASGTMYFVFYFSIPIIILNINNFRLFTFKKISLAIFSLLTLIFIFFASYSSSLTNDQVVDKTVDRLAAQPQMWWALDRISTALPQDNVFLSKYLGIGEERRNSGTYYLMDQVARKEIVDERYENNGTFTSSGFMNNSYLFGYYLGGIVNIVLGLIVGVIVSFLKYSLYSNNIFVIFITFKLYLKFQNMILEGNMTNVFTLNTFIFFFIILLFLKIFCHKKVSYD